MKRKLRHLLLVWKNNRQISKQIRKGTLWSILLLAFVIPSSASAVAPIVTGKGWRSPGEGYIFEVKVYSRYADWAYIRVSYPYWGEYAKMFGPYWASAASGKQQLFNYAAKYSGCGPLRLQIAVENYGHITWTETGDINTCTFTAITEG